MNKRLSGDETEDPSFPKQQFPPKDKCPKCYKNSSNTNNETTSASPFDIHETMKYLLSFYSIHGIEGEEELDKKSSDYFATKITTKRMTREALKTNVTTSPATSASTTTSKETAVAVIPIADQTADDEFYNVDIIDLQSSLSYIFRSEVSRFEQIEGENYKILKQWIVILLKVIFKKKKYN